MSGDLHCVEVDGSERKEVQRIRHQLLSDEFVDDRLAKRANVERVAAGEMLDAPRELRRTHRVDTADGNLTFRPHDGAAADRTRRRHGKGLLRARALLGNDGINRRNDIPRLHQPHVVSDPDVLPRDLVRIVQRRTRDHGPRQLRRLQFRDWRQNARPPHLHGDRLDDRLRPLGRILVGARPSRAVCRRAENVVELPLVNLDDSAVDFELERMPPLLQLVNCRKDLVHRLA